MNVSTCASPDFMVVCKDQRTLKIYLAKSSSNSALNRGQRNHFFPLFEVFRRAHPKAGAGLQRYWLRLRAQTEEEAFALKVDASDGLAVEVTRFVSHWCSLSQKIYRPIAVEQT